MKSRALNVPLSIVALIVLFGMFIPCVNGEETITYVYDDLNRLTEVVYGNNTSVQYTYDEVGNRMQVTTHALDTAAPVTTAKPAGGIYNSSRSVTLSCTDGDGSGCDRIYYTKDGTTPTTTSSVYSSQIGIASTTTLKFFATDKAGNSEQVKTEVYTIDTAAPVTTAKPAGGIYNSSRSVTLSCTDGDGSGCDRIYYTKDGTTPTTASSVYSSQIGIASTTTLKFFAADKAGNSEQVKTEVYTIDTTAPNGTIDINSGAVATNNPNVTLTLSCDDARGCSQMQFSNDNVTYSSPESYASKKEWTLAAGDGPKTVRVKFIDSAGNTSSACSDTITLDTAAPVTTAKPAGGIYNSSRSVTLSCTDGDGSGCDRIYYTKDGTTPTTASSVYSSQIGIASTTTLKFFAADKAGNSGKVKTEVYTIDTTAPVTTAKPAGWFYDTEQKVRLSCTDAGGSGCGRIYYTKDGTTPTTASKVYSTPIHVSNIAVLRFFAVDKAGNKEQVKTEVYICFWRWFKDYLGKVSK